MAWIGLVLGGGALAEPVPAAGGQALDGLARATASLLDEGTERTTRADEFGAAVESLGGNWGVDSGWQSTKVSLDLPVALTPAGGELLAEAVRRPAFRDARRAQVPQRPGGGQAGELRPARAARPAGPARRAVRRGRPGTAGWPAGTPESSAALDARGGARLPRASGCAAPACCWWPADLDAIDLDALAARGLRGRRRGRARPARPARPPLPDPARLVIADRPGAVQSTLRIGHPAPTRGRADRGRGRTWWRCGWPARSWAARSAPGSTTSCARSRATPTARTAPSTWAVRRVFTRSAPRCGPTPPPRPWPTRCGSSRSSWRRRERGGARADPLLPGRRDPDRAAEPWLGRRSG